MSLKRKVLKTIQRLQKLYRSGIISYPRVDNSFINFSESYDMYPHAPFPILAESFKPIQQEKVTLDKDSSLLFLSILRIVSPANLESFAETIDSYFKDDLEYINVKKKEKLFSILKKLDIFLSNNKLSQKDILDMYGDIFDESKKRVFANYKIKSFYFSVDKNTRIGKIIPRSQELEISEDNTQKENFYSSIKEKKRIKDALEEYDRMKKLELSLTKRIEEQLKNMAARMGDARK